MFRYTIFLFLIACFPNRVFKKDFITLSESPCVDGTILNIHQAGCESFYWGTAGDGEILKIRCAYAPEMNWWTTRSFYAVPHDYSLEYSNWSIYCTDRYVDVYVTPTGVQLETQ